MTYSNVKFHLVVEPYGGTTANNTRVTSLVWPDAPSLLGRIGTQCCLPTDAHRSLVMAYSWHPTFTWQPTLPAQCHGSAYANWQAIKASWLAQWIPAGFKGVVCFDIEPLSLITMEATDTQIAADLASFFPGQTLAEVFGANLQNDLTKLLETQYPDILRYGWFGLADPHSVHLLDQKGYARGHLTQLAAARKPAVLGVPMPVRYWDSTGLSTVNRRSSSWSLSDALLAAYYGPCLPRRGIVFIRPTRLNPEDLSCMTPDETKELLDWHVAQGYQEFVIWDNVYADNNVTQIQNWIDHALTPLL